MSDFGSLLSAARNGDRSARDELFDRVYPRVRRMVHASMNSEIRGRRPWLSALFSTGDVVQEVCRSVLRDIDAFRGDNEWAFVSYLSTVVRNRLVDAIRFHEAVRRDQRRVNGSAEEFDLVTPSRGPATKALDHDEIVKFRTVLASFTDKEQALLRLRLEGGCTFDEIAERLGFNHADSARKTFHTLQARLLVRLRAAGLSS